MDEEKFWNKYASYRKGGLRKGQSLMNAFYDVDPLAERGLVLGNADCFYDDTKIPAFMTAVFNVDAVTAQAMTDSLF